jgi:surface polysaccharide O-acyltransferase-like enzyme
MFEYGGLDLVLSKKLLLCLAFFGLLERCRDHRSKVLTLISATSLAIFFLHMIFLMVLKKLDLATAQKSLGWMSPCRRQS